MTANKVEKGGLAPAEISMLDLQNIINTKIRFLLTKEINALAANKEKTGSIDVESAVREAYKSLRTILLLGSAGIGKSSIIRAVVDQINEFIDEHNAKSPLKIESRANLIMINAPAQSPTLIEGVPVPDLENGIMHWLKDGRFPDGNDKDIHIILIDELASATPYMQVVLHEPILDRTVSGKPLPARTIILAASNQITDKGHVQEIPSTVANRCQIFKVKPVFEQWRNVAYENGFHPAVVAYLEASGGGPLNIDGETFQAYGKGNVCFNTPRSWEAVSSELQMAETLNLSTTSELMNMQIQGHIGLAQSAQFTAFLRNIEDAKSPMAIVEAKTEEIPSFVPKKKGTSGEAQVKSIHKAYFMVNAMAAWMIANPPAKGDKDSEEKWKKGLIFLKEVADEHGTIFSVNAVSQIFRSNSGLIDQISKLGGPSIIAWLGGPEIVKAFQAVNDMRNKLSGGKV